MKLNSGRKIVIILSTILVLLAVVIGGFTYWHNRAEADGEQLSVNEIGQAKSAFSFNTEVTNGWYMGPANETSLAVFGDRTIDETTGEESTDTHFALIGYRDDGVSQSKWLEDLETRSSADYTLVADEVLPMTLQTNSGPLSYNLHTYTNQLKPGKAQPYYASNDREAHGYIPYGNGYIRIQGYATPGSRLPEVIEAIKALKLDMEKLSPSDKCTDRDRDIDNCVPAGKCGPTPEIDARVDCAIKGYDRKFNPAI